MNRFSKIEDVWSYLDAIPMFQNSGAAASNFNLYNIRSFCDRLGNPQDQFPSIHVAGTNGKGTTCYLLEQIYASSGYKTGLFTSPHLVRYNERIRIEQQEIPDQYILQFFQQADQLLQKIKLSYFEISTVLAFWYFKEQNVEIAIIEVGLGGRLDSTNIITPEVAVITSIGLDHQEILGNTIVQIATEKAGIIKQGKPVIIGNISGNERDIILTQARSKDCTVFEVSALKPEWDGGSTILKAEDQILSTSFIEKVNIWNVAIAWKVTDLLEESFPVNREIKVEAIESFRGAPARFEKLHTQYEWYFSGSHNVQALQSSLEAIEHMKPKANCVLVFSAMKDKWTEQTQEMLSGFKRTWFVQQDAERALRFDQINKEMEVELLDENTAKNILKELKTELVIFMGSFYFYPTIKRWIKNVL
ncbi:MAG: Mur ligase family protein [Gracilimonas sp.]|nr:Mur ligase family protein [Gracilimonas sp.]